MEVSEANPETWAVGFEDECWWSRVALPTLSSWAEEGKPLRLIQKSLAKDDPSEATKAVSCYGLYLPQIGDTWLRFVDGRPISSITTQLLQWCAQRLQALGKKVVVLIWEKASWHISKVLKLMRRPVSPTSISSVSPHVLVGNWSLVRQLFFRNFSS